MAAASTEVNVDLKEQNANLLLVRGEALESFCCHEFCSSQGRGHTHALVCSGEGQHSDSRRHVTADAKIYVDREGKQPLTGYDRVTCEQYWDALGFQHPCSAAEQREFALCPHYCSHSSHKALTEDARPRCCLPALHEPAPAALNLPAGYIRAGGHFLPSTCRHAVTEDLQLSAETALDSPFPSLSPTASHPSLVLCAVLCSFILIDRSGSMGLGPQPTDADLLVSRAHTLYHSHPHSALSALSATQVDLDASVRLHSCRQGSWALSSVALAISSTTARAVRCRASGASSTSAPPSTVPWTASLSCPSTTSAPAP